MPFKKYYPVTAMLVKNMNKYGQIEMQKEYLRSMLTLVKKLLKFKIGHIAMTSLFISTWEVKPGNLVHTV